MAGRRGLSGRRRLLGVGLAVVLLLVGCGTQERYRVLSFFFDGVPDPNAPPASAGEEETGDYVGRPADAKGLTYYRHKPYDENKCDACHRSTGGQMMEFSALDDSICAGCHPGTTTQYRYMHGPVATGQCRVCHLPHESTVPHLLKSAPAVLCTTCHTARHADA